MTKIKFRAWHTEQKRFIPITQIDFNYGVLPKKIKPSGVWNWVPMSKIRLYMFTGLKDKNGKEIWEGSIVRRPRIHTNNYLNAKVVYNHAEFRLKFRHCAELYRLANVLHVNSLEVVGSVEENPELLNI